MATVTSATNASYCAVVVDDNRDTAESLARLLTLMGCQPTSVTEPRAVLAEVARAKPHIVFLDIGMPGIDGYQVASTLRRLHDSDALKLVAVTGYNTQQDRFRTRKAGFDAHVVKPIDPTILESILKTLLESP